MQGGSRLAIQFQGAQKEEDGLDPDHKASPCARPELGFALRFPP